MQNEDHRIAYWCNRYNLPFNNGSVNDTYDIYLTSGTSKVHTIFHPDKVSAKRKLYIVEPLFGEGVYSTYDTAFVPNEFGARRLSGMGYRGRIVVSGYPPFERARNVKYRPNKRFVVFSDWLFLRDHTKGMINDAIGWAKENKLDLWVKPHPYQNWRDTEVLPELEYCKSLGINCYHPKEVSLWDIIEDCSMACTYHSLAGLETTLANIPTLLYAHCTNSREPEFEFELNTFNATEKNRESLMSYYKTENVVKDIISEVER
jgi:hypothetical protein